MGRGPRIGSGCVCRDPCPCRGCVGGQVSDPSLGGRNGLRHLCGYLWNETGLVSCEMGCLCEIFLGSALVCLGCDPGALLTGFALAEVVFSLGSGCVPVSSIGSSPVLPWICCDCVRLCEDEDRKSVV